jgi:hypothetical protein
MNRTNEYRAKAFELLSLAETVNDPERRADMLRFARMWKSLSERCPICGPSTSYPGLGIRLIGTTPGYIRAAG